MRSVTAQIGTSPLLGQGVGSAAVLGAVNSFAAHGTVCELRTQTLDLGLAIADETAHILDRANELPGMDPTQAGPACLRGNQRLVGWRGNGSMRKQEDILRVPAFH